MNEHDDNNLNKKQDNNINNKKRIIITSIITIIAVLILIALYFILDLGKYFTDIDYLGKVINSDNGRLVYIFINFLQTTLIPITNIPTIMAGTQIYGPWDAANLAIVGVLSGSVISFYIGRIFGRKLVNWMLGEETVNKYLEMARGRENVVVFLILLLPGFPDDIICILAGLTSMSFRFFSITILITRTIPLYLVAYSASIIPLDTVWGWIVIILLYGIIFYISQLVLKNWDSILAKFNKDNNNNNKDS